MADDDDSTIFIDVSARVDERAAEDAGRKVRDQVKDGAKGTGKVIGDLLHSELGDALKGAIGPTVRDWAADTGKSVGSTLGRSIAGDLGESVGSELGRMLGSSGAEGILGSLGVDKVSDKIHGLVGDVHGLSDAFKDIKAGDTAKGINDISDGLKKLGVNASDLPGPLGQVADKSKGLMDVYSSLKGDIKDVTGLFGDFVKISPGVESAFGGIAAAATEAAGPIAAAVAALYGMKEVYDWSMGHVDQDLGAHAPFLPNAPFTPQGLPNAGAPVPGLDRRAPQTPQEFYTYGPGQSVPVRPSQPPAGAAPPPPLPPPAPAAPPAPPRAAPGGPQTGSPAWQYTHPHGAGFSSTTGGTGVHLIDSVTSVSSPSDIPAAGAGVSNLYRVAQALEGTPYSQALRNDCSGMVSKLANAALGLPPVASFSTQNEGQWLTSHGFQPGLGGPNDLNIGWYNNGSNPNDGHTAATLPGGVNAESGGSVGSFALGGKVGASSSQFDHHMYLPMGAGAPRGGVRPAGYGSGPSGSGGPTFGGSMGLPGGISAALGSGPAGGGALPIPGIPYSPNFNESNSYTPRQQQQMGSGQGFGLTGGGLIGFLENGLPAVGVAAASGASAYGSGAGSGAAAALAQQLWANIGQPELNQAITSAGKAAATMAMAPIETGWLGGGQMGAPEVGSPAQSGWPGKLLGSFMGSQFSGANIAGATQPPKDPQSDDDSDNGENTDPGSIGKKQGGKPQGRGASGPAGTVDDPLHVNVKNQPSAPPQGSATSHANATAVQSAITV